jgi:hypothetical protein
MQNASVTCTAYSHLHASAYISTRQHTSYVRICQHTSAPCARCCRACRTYRCQRRHLKYADVCGRMRTYAHRVRIVAERVAYIGVSADISKRLTHVRKPAAGCYMQRRPFEVTGFTCIYIGVATFTSKYTHIHTHIHTHTHTHGAYGECLRRHAPRLDIRPHALRMQPSAAPSTRHDLALPTAHVSIRQHMSAYASICQHTPAFVSIRQHMSAYASICQHAACSRHELALAPACIGVIAYIGVKAYIGIYILHI